MKKIYLGLLCSLFLVGGSNTMALATENEQPETIQSAFVVFPEVDISPEELEIAVENDGSLYPSNPLARGGTIPTGEKKLGTHNVNETFSGKGTLYTTSKFYGGTKYRVSISNKGKSAITVVAKRSWKDYGSTKISAGKTGSFEFSNIESGTRFWVAFRGSNMDVTGSIKKL